MAGRTTSWRRLAILSLLFLGPLAALVVVLMTSDDDPSADGAAPTTSAVASPSPTAGTTDATTTGTPPATAGATTTFTLGHGPAGTAAGGVEVVGQDVGVVVRTAFDNCTAPPDSCWQITGGAVASESPGGELVLDPAAGTLSGALEERWSCAGTCTFDTRDLALIIDVSATLGAPIDDGTLGPPPRPLTGEATIELDATFEQDSPSSVCGGAPCRSVRRLVATVPVTGELRGDLVRVTVERPPEHDGVPRTQDWSVRSSTSWRLPVEPLPG